MSYPYSRGWRKDGEITPIGQRILDLLADGQLHHPKEMVEKCIDFHEQYEPHITRQVIRNEICELRKILKDRGQSIDCVMRNRTTYYRQFVLINHLRDSQK